ncbi:MAG: hypothetical protein AAF363_09210 [Bacteroidota bacterium]
MKILEIRKLVENHTEEELQVAELAYEEGSLPGFEIGGDNEGEQFTHVIAARWILNKMNADSLVFKEALRAYTSKVRESINCN